jgi:hypothetical protein
MGPDWTLKAGPDSALIDINAGRWLDGTAKMRGLQDR